MCIIIYSPEGKSISKETLELCGKNNSDGIGFALLAGNMAHVSKGYETLDEFKLQWDITHDLNIPFVIHFRISTGSEVNSANCHPFDIQNNPKHLHYKSERILFHNGIVGQSTLKQSDTSILADCLRGMSLSKADKLLKLFNSSRFLMFWRGKVYLYGTWIKDNGLYYSNSSYKSLPVLVYDSKGKNYVWEYDDYKSSWGVCDICQKSAYLYDVGKLRLCYNCKKDFTE